MTRYLVFARNCFMTQFMYRVSFFFKALTNIVYVVLIYFLWKAIYENSDGVLNGMTFNQTFVYLACAGSMFVLFLTYIDWFVARKINDGEIIMDMLKPIDFQLQRVSFSFGFFLSNLIVVTIPAFLIIIFAFKADIPVGINLVFFPVSVLLAYLIGTTIDFCMGLFSFYTESIWGIYAVKESTVLFLSGALIPLNFFPPLARTVLSFLPFQAIYNIPLTILTSYQIGFTDYLRMIGIQCFWLIVLFLISRLFFWRASKILTVNGG
jgi:ABC-2 type transport system permease protein